MSGKTIIVTGGAGFIGSAVVRRLIRATDWRVVNVDCLTYAGNPEAVAEVVADPRYVFERVDIRDAAGVAGVFERHRPDGVIHLAAESHVDRSIAGPAAFIQTNIVGTYNLLEAAREHWLGMAADSWLGFRFLHVSTDEVYGALGETGAFTEDSPMLPNSPYAASKAASDHLVRAWHHTYGLPVLISHCSNNYGPWQHEEKLIPRMILNALAGRPLPIYGDGRQVRDWLYVEDHAEALLRVFEQGRVGEVYNIGGQAERRNIEVVRLLCELLEEMAPDRPAGVKRYADLITHVADRPGHDQRYALDIGKIEHELGWRPSVRFETGLRWTVEWYLGRR